MTDYLLSLRNVMPPLKKRGSGCRNYSRRRWMARHGANRGMRILAIKSRIIVVVLAPWLPDGYSRIFIIVSVWPFGLLDYGSAMLRCKV